ncbi:MAG: riboflavin synthase [Polyangiaceae bacterium]
MFTGLVEEVGVLLTLARRGPSARARVATKLGAEGDPLALGESIAVNGVCLTVDAINGDGFEADVSIETLSATTLGRLGPTSRVNLERATQLGGRMGGHTVLGHVDGLITMVELATEGEARRATFEAPAELGPLLARKGSVAIDGVSLTINTVSDAPGATRFSVMWIPHTLSRTTLPELRPGSAANVEVDVLARYVARQLGFAAASSSQSDGDREASLLEKLRSGGYM